ncbi:PorT family protein [Enhygromyxa salina]|nr:PorT family protein [Enhygromyxa salina]
MLHKLIAPACALAALSISSIALAGEVPASEPAAEAVEAAEASDASAEVNDEAVKQVEATAPVTLENEVAASAELGEMERLSHGGRLSLGAARTLAGLTGVNVRYYLTDHFHIGLNLGVATFSYREPDFTGDPIDCGTDQKDASCTKNTRTLAYIGSSVEGVYWILGKPAGNWPFQADFGIGGRLGFQHYVNSTDVGNDLDDPLQLTAEVPLIIMLSLGENFSIAPEFGAVFRWNPGSRLQGPTEMPPDPGDSNPGFGSNGRFEAGDMSGPGFGFEITDNVGLFGGASLLYAF